MVHDPYSNRKLQTVLNPLALQIPRRENHYLESGHRIDSISDINYHWKWRVHFTGYLLFGFPGNQELFKLTQIMHPVDQDLIRPLQ